MYSQVGDKKLFPSKWDKSEQKSIHNFLLGLASECEASNGTFCINSRYNFQFCWSSALFSISSLVDRASSKTSSCLEIRKKEQQMLLRDSRLEWRRKKITFTSTDGPVSRKIYGGIFQNTLRKLLEIFQKCLRENVIYEVEKFPI